MQTWPHAHFPCAKLCASNMHVFPDHSIRCALDDSSSHVFCVHQILCSPFMDGQTKGRENVKSKNSANTCVSIAALDAPRTKTQNHLSVQVRWRFGAVIFVPVSDFFHIFPAREIFMGHVSSRKQGSCSDSERVCV
jgi:hypothetical protein